MQNSLLNKNQTESVEIAHNIWFGEGKKEINDKKCAQQKIK